VPLGTGRRGLHPRGRRRVMHGDLLTCDMQLQYVVCLPATHFVRLLVSNCKNIHETVLLYFLNVQVLK
jgi:hypothetical protein